MKRVLHGTGNLNFEQDGTHLAENSFEQDGTQLAENSFEQDGTHLAEHSFEQDYQLQMEFSNFKYENIA